MATTTQPSARQPRNPALVALDITAGVLLAVVGLGIGIGVVFAVSQYPALVPECGSELADGVPCDSAGLINTVVIAVTGITVFAFALSLGMFAVRIIQKRVSWYWPLLGAIVTVTAFYAGTAVVGSAAA